MLVRVLAAQMSGANTAASGCYIQMSLSGLNQATFPEYILVEMVCSVVSRVQVMLCSSQKSLGLVRETPHPLLPYTHIVNHMSDTGLKRKEKGKEKKTRRR